jgi:hypothetical protein
MSIFFELISFGSYRLIALYCCGCFIRHRVVVILRWRSFILQVTRWLYFWGIFRTVLYGFVFVLTPSSTFTTLFFQNFPITTLFLVINFFAFNFPLCVDSTVFLRFLFVIYSLSMRLSYLIVYYNCFDLWWCYVDCFLI